MNISSNEIKIPNNSINITTNAISSHLHQAVIDIGPEIVDAVSKQTISLYAKHSQPQGLKHQVLPAEYVKNEHKEGITNNVKKFLLKHIVLDFLINQIIAKKIPAANHPRLTNMELLANQHARYFFDLSVAAPIILKEWKLFSFKSPKRKRYKDLDKQVELFIKQEQSNSKKQDHETVQENDWIYFEVAPIDKNKKPILPLHKINLWMKINTKYVAKPFQSLFINKKTSNIFITDKTPLDDSFQDNISQTNPFLITIKSIIKGSYLSIDAFRNTFKLKNKKEIQAKLIEVFSYRNDISQRRSIIEEVFHLLFAKHRFEIPKHLTIRKQESLLLSLKSLPDYQVYKSQKDFPEKITLLAEKLLKEEILIDQITYQENIKTSTKDIKHYLTFFNNDRLREFVYFKPSLEPIEETDIPLHESFLKQAVTREKTLNYIIHTLTK